MARGRMISKSLSTSEKYAALVPAGGALAEFCQALYPLLVVHTDDFGRLQGDPFTVKSLCYPTSPRSLAEFATGLETLQRVGLITWYDVRDKRFIQIMQFEHHQAGLHKRTASKFPETPERPETLGNSRIRQPISFRDGSSVTHLSIASISAEMPPSPELAENVALADFPEIPGISRLREEKRRELKIPPTPLTKGGRLTRAELRHAREVRARVYGRCPHQPPCGSYGTCVVTIAWSIRAKATAS